MGFISFNKTPKHKRFDFIPRYYDPRKEELENLVNAHRNKDDTSLSKDRIRSGLRSRYRGNADLKKKGERSANVRLLSIIIVLFVVTYLLLRSDSILHMMESFLGTPNQ